MSEPAETALLKQCVKTGESSAGEHLIVCHLVWPLDVQDALQAAHMEGVDLENALLVFHQPSWSNWP